MPLVTAKVTSPPGDMVIMCERVVSAPLATLRLPGTVTLGGRHRYTGVMVVREEAVHEGQAAGEELVL